MWPFSFSHAVYLQYSIDHDTMSFPLSSCSSFSWSLLIRYFVANFYNVLEKHLWILEQIIMNDDALLDKGRTSTSCKQTNSCRTKTWFSWVFSCQVRICYKLLLILFQWDLTSPMALYFQRSDRQFSPPPSTHFLVN